MPKENISVTVTLTTDKAIDALKGALRVALTEMERWRDMRECDCPPEGHICGLPRLERSIAKAKAALTIKRSQ
jgi:hypothetical protein